MNLLNLFQKFNSLKTRIKGLVYNYLFFKGKAKKLKLSTNIEMFGKLTLGSNIYIGSNSKIYKNNEIKNNVYIGDNVELRSNGKNKIIIGANTTINRGTLIMGTVTIYENCLIAPLCVIVGSNHNFTDTKKNINEQGLNSKGILIHENVWVAAQVTIVDGVTIGKNSIIGAGAVVTKDIPENSIVVGNPAKVIKSRV